MALLRRKRLVRFSAYELTFIGPREGESLTRGRPSVIRDGISPKLRFCPCNVLWSYAPSSSEHAKKLPRQCAGEGALEMTSNSLRRKKR